MIIGAVFTVATGLVSMWAKRRDTQLKEQKALIEKAEAKRAKADWVMRMLRENGEEALVREMGHNWRDRYDSTTPTDFGGLNE
ncbi:hypothetical protein D3C72_2407510 [compost metagenome]